MLLGTFGAILQLQELDLPAELRRRVLTLQAAPRKLRGVLRFALRTGLRAALEAGDSVAAACGWKLFFLAPRMLLHRPAGQQFVQANELEQRCDSFRRGEWLQLLREATAASCAGGNRSGPGTDEQARAARAVQLVQLGELSAAARALTAEPLAPGNADTLAELRDPARRPPAAQVPLSDAVLGHRKTAGCPLPATVLLGCLRGARRGSAAGPSGATNEHLRLLLDDPSDCACTPPPSCRALGQRRRARAGPPGSAAGAHGCAAQAQWPRTGTRRWRRFPAPGLPCAGAARSGVGEQSLRTRLVVECPNSEGLEA